MLLSNFIDMPFNYKFSLFITFFSLQCFLSFGQEKGKLAGKVADSKSSEELIGATIGIEGSSIGVATDLDGKYLLNLDEGNYVIIVSYVGYASKKFPNVEIKKGEIVYLDVNLDETVNELEEVVIVAETNKETTNTLLLEQKNSVAVSSGVSAELIRKTPDRSTADIMKRVSGASVQDNRFAIVRGLNDRYNMVFLNGAPMSSTESDRKAFSLDFIPAPLIDNMKIQKTASPDMPGDFAGGFIQINTKDIPDQNQFFLNVQGGTHSQTTSQSFNKSEVKSSTDWLGYDNGPRQLPKDLYSLDVINDDFGNDWKYGALNTTKFNNNNSYNSVKARPNYAIQGGISRRINLGPNPLGVILAFTYNNQLRTTPSTFSQPDIDPLQPSLNSATYTGKYDVVNYKNNILAGGVFNLSYKIRQSTKLSLKNLITSNSDNQAIFREGSARQDIINDTLLVKDYTYWYQSSRLLSSQFNGEHVFGATKSKLKLTLGITDINRKIPDLKKTTYTSGVDIVYQRDSDNEIIGQTKIRHPYSASISGKGEGYDAQKMGKFFSNLDERSYFIGADYAYPLNFLYKTELKAGASRFIRDRTFIARTFSYIDDQNHTKWFLINPGVLDAKSDYLRRDINSLYNSQLFQLNEPNQSTGVFLTENTKSDNHYTASARLNSAFIMADIFIISKVRINGGLRVEDYNQNLTATFLNGVDSRISSTVQDYLPSGNLIYSVTNKSNLRVSLSKTVSRPEFREFMPFAFYDVNLNATVVGNPELVRTSIDNYDFKYEVYPLPGQFFSINPFLKKFTNPIENVAQTSSGLLTYSFANAKSAENFGVEFEARSTFQLLDSLFGTRSFGKFSIFGNYAIIRSNIDLSNQIATTVTSRPLQGQSPYVLNAGLQYSNEKRGWDVALNVNRIGRRLAYVSVEKAYLIWENPRTVLDFSVSKRINKYLQVRGTIGDLLAQNLVFYRDFNDNGKYDKDIDNAVYNYKYGYTTSLQLNMTF